MNTIEHFVGGKSFSGDSKRVCKVFNPATGEQSSDVKLASTKDVNQAVENAKNAFESWAYFDNSILAFNQMKIISKQHLVAKTLLSP